MFRALARVVTDAMDHTVDSPGAEIVLVRQRANCGARQRALADQLLELLLQLSWIIGLLTVPRRRAGLDDYRVLAPGLARVGQMLRKRAYDQLLVCFGQLARYECF